MAKQKIIDEYPYILHTPTIYDEATMIERSHSFYTWAAQRRSCRHFAETPIPKEVMDNIIRTANTAPSGAHLQPWTFCVVQNKELQQQIRAAAEAEEKKSYAGRMNDEWINDLKPLGTDWQKEFLTTAPCLIIVFKQSYGMVNNTKKQHYYVNESVGIACGLLLAAVHNAGLVALTHTPSPMQFLTQLLQRPENEKPFLLIPIGYAAEECYVPDIQRKPLEAIKITYE